MRQNSGLKFKPTQIANSQNTNEKNFLKKTAQQPAYKETENKPDKGKIYPDHAVFKHITQKSGLPLCSAYPVLPSWRPPFFRQVPGLP